MLSLVGLVTTSIGLNNSEYEVNAVSKEQTQTTSQAIISSREKSPKQFHSVLSVSDGDTIRVSINGKVETIRFIGIDTPETKDPRKSVECFGQEASDYMKALVEGKSVGLMQDSTQSNRDKYGRLLRYVYLEDGSFVNLKMIQDGYAYEYTYDSNPYLQQSGFIAAEDEAREAGRGLWSDQTCSGLRDPSVVAQEPTAIEVYYANCSAVRSAGAAPLYNDQPGYRTGLDRDQDGVACE